MASLTDVENAVAALLVLVTGREIVQGRVGEGPVPSVPFVMWDMERITLDDLPRVEIDGTDQIVIASNTPLEFVINMIGGAAMSDMVKFALSLRQSQRSADLYKLCGLSGVSQMLDLSAVEIGTFRQRVEMRLTVFTALDLTAPAEWIETSCVQVREASKEFDETYCYTQGECR